MALKSSFRIFIFFGMLNAMLSLLLYCIFSYILYWKWNVYANFDLIFRTVYYLNMNAAHCTLHIAHLACVTSTRVHFSFCSRFISLFIKVQYFYVHIFMAALIAIFVLFLYSCFVSLDFLYSAFMFCFDVFFLFNCYYNKCFCLCGLWPT